MPWLTLSAPFSHRITLRQPPAARRHSLTAHYRRIFPLARDEGMAPRRGDCRPHPQRPEAGRHPRRSADQVRACRQSQNGQGFEFHGVANDPDPRREDHRMSVATSEIGTRNGHQSGIDRCPLSGGRTDLVLSRLMSPCEPSDTRIDEILFAPLAGNVRWIPHPGDLSLRAPRRKFRNGEKLMTKLVALLSALTVCSGLSTAVAQQAPAENKGMKAEALSGFPLGKQGLDDLAQRQIASERLWRRPTGR